jgi:hypothetical protein
MAWKQCGCGKRINVTSTSAADPRCRDCRYPHRWPVATCPCGTSFQSDHSRKVYCTKRCARTYGERKPRTPRVHHWRSIVVYTQCHSCFAPLTAKSRKRYCNDTCAGRVTGKRHKVWFPTCQTCGLVFTCRNGQSLRCKPCRVRHAWERKTYHKKVSKLVDYIGHRDKWKCAICGRKVSQEPFQHGNPWSKTVDHVVPEAECRRLGWSLDEADNPSNLRLAHMRCNNLRRDKGGGEQLALVG